MVKATGEAVQMYSKMLGFLSVIFIVGSVMFTMAVRKGQQQQGTQAHHL